MHTALLHRKKTSLGAFRLLTLSLSFPFLFFIYLFFCPALNEGLYQSLAVHPTHEFIDTSHPVLISEYTGEHCFFPVLNAKNETLLHGVYFKTTAQKALGTAIISPGNSFCLRTILGCRQGMKMLEAGYNIFYYDYEGFGESQGAPDYKKLGNDGLSALKYVNDSLHQTRVVLYGLSMGTGVSAYIAEHAPVAAVIMDSPYRSPEQTLKLWAPLVNVYPHAMFPQPYYDNEAFLKGKHVPTLIVTKGLDYITFTKEAVALTKVATEPVASVVLPKSTHFGINLSDGELYDNALRSFLAKLDTGQNLVQAGAK